MPPHQKNEFMRPWKNITTVSPILMVFGRLVFYLFNVHKLCVSIPPADGANFQHLAQQGVTCQPAARFTVHLQRGGEFGCFGRAGKTLVPRTQQNFSSFK